MTRDFLIEFDNDEDMENCYRVLSDISDQNNVKLFGILDKREKSLFVTLTYPEDIKDASFSGLYENIILADELVFVAIKNGEHCEKGYCFYSKGIKKFQPLENSHVKNIFFSIENYFNT